MCLLCSGVFVLCNTLYLYGNIWILLKPTVIITLPHDSSSRVFYCVGVTGVEAIK